MAKLLYVKASPRGSRSKSITVADAFVKTYRSANPGDTVETVNVFDDGIPAFDGSAVEAKYEILHGKKPGAEQLKAWKDVERIIEQFKGADKYVLAVPMWNFGIPYRLKQYFDVIVQPGYTFTFSAEQGYKGLVTGKSVLAVYSRGGEYPAGTDAEAFDLQKRYVELVLGFMGLTEIHSVIVEPTLQGGPDVAQQKVQEAISRACNIAAAF